MINHSIPCKAFIAITASTVVGSVIWCIVANVFGIPITLFVASLALGVTIIAKKRYSTTLFDDLDFTPASDHWSLPPQSSVDPLQNENQALITIEYNKIDPKLSDEFEQSVHELGHILKNEGMAYWELFRPLRYWLLHRNQDC